MTSNFTNDSTQRSILFISRTIIPSHQTHNIASHHTEWQRQTDYKYYKYKWPAEKPIPLNNQIIMGAVGLVS